MNIIPGTKSHAIALYELLVPLWPDTNPQLNYENCWELLVAVMLSAQCTDAQVNKVTPILFERWPGPSELASASIDEVETIIHSTGFFHTKARHIIATAQCVLQEHDSKVPDTIESLILLPGVGRKTANLIVSACFGKPGIIVDTHVLRTARRLGLAPTKSAEISERMIAAVVPQKNHTAFSHALNRHGKFICTARSPKCESCVVFPLCSEKNR